MQFGRLDLSSFRNVVPHSVASSNIPTPWTFLRPIDLTQHGKRQVSTLSPSIRNRFITLPYQPMMSPVTIHSPIQHAMNTIGTQHSASSQVVIPQTGVLVQ